MRSSWRQWPDVAKHFRRATEVYCMIPDPSDRLIIATMKSGRQFMSISHHLVDHESLDSRELSEAFDWIRKTQTRILGGNHHEVISTLLGKAEMLYYRLNNEELAFSVACEALELVESCETATDSDLLSVYNVIANYCPEEDENSLYYCIKCMQHVENSGGMYASAGLIIYRAAVRLVELEEYSDGLEILRQVILFTERIMGKSNDVYVLACDCAGTACWNLSRWEEAATYYEAAKEGFCNAVLYMGLTMRELDHRIKYFKRRASEDNNSHTLSSDERTDTANRPKKFPFMETEKWADQMRQVKELAKQLDDSSCGIKKLRDS